MYSEVFLRFRREVRFERLMTGMPVSARPADVLSRTALRRNSDLASLVAHAGTEANLIYLVFRDAPDELRFHIEARSRLGSVRVLADCSERVTNRFVAAAGRQGNPLERAEIGIYADGVLVASGARVRFGVRLVERFADTIFGDVVVGVWVALLTGLLTRQWWDAGIVGGSAVLCLLCWLLIELERGGRRGYDYRSV